MLVKIYPLYRTLFPVFLFSLVACESRDDMPGDFEVSVETTISTAHISWTEAENADRYEVFLETEKLSDTLYSDNSVTLSGLTGDFTYYGQVVAVNEAGRKIKPFTFTTTAVPPNQDHKRLSLVTVAYQRYGSSEVRYDTIRYSFVYDASNRIRFVHKENTAHWQRYAWQQMKKAIEIYEFEYLSRRLHINRLDQDSTLTGRISFHFNNDSYIFPESAGIHVRFFVDSMTFNYDKNEFVNRITYYKNGVVSHQMSYRNHGSNLYVNPPSSYNPSDTLSVNYSDDLEVYFNQYCGLIALMDTSATMATNVLFYPLNIMKSSRNAAIALSEPRPGYDKFDYEVDNGIIKGFFYFYQDNTYLTWDVSIEYE